MSLGEMKGTGFASKYTVNKPSTVYVKAVKQVASAPKGALISKTASTTWTQPIIPIKTDLASIIGAWVGIGSATTKKDIVESASGLIATEKMLTPAYDIRTGYKGAVTTTTFKEEISKEIAKDTANKEYWDAPTNPITSIKSIDLGLDLGLPDLGSILDNVKWVLIGGAVLIGVYFVAKAFGGKK